MQKSLLPLVVLAVCLSASCSTTTENDQDSNSDSTVLVEDNGTDGNAALTARTQLSESDSYIDLRTGKPIRIRRGENGLYMSESGDLGIYVNTTTSDTFYGGQAFNVGGHLLHNDGSDWEVDQNWLNSQSATNYGDGMLNEPEKVQVQDDGDYKAKYKEGDIKEKMKVDADGKDMKYKYKDDENDTKLKITDDQIKYKDPNGKTEIESDGSIKNKPNK
jgi:hypothetical protein